MSGCELYEIWISIFAPTSRAVKLKWDQLSVRAKRAWDQVAEGIEDFYDNELEDEVQSRIEAR